MTPNQPNTPDAIDLLMEEVIAEVANQAIPAGLQARLKAHARAQAEAESEAVSNAKSRRQTMQLVPATTPAPAANVLHFQQLDRTGGRGMSPQSIGVAAIFNIAAVLLLALQVHTMRTIQHQRETIAYVQPAPPPEPVNPAVKIPPPPPVPRPLVKIAPKILLPEVKLPEPTVARLEPMPKPLPMVAPAPPKVVVAAAAPRPAAVNLAQSASVVNQDQHPSAVALGHPDNPVHASTSAPSAISLGQRGVAGMPAANSGGGPASARVNLGSGQPGGSIGGTGSRAVAGVKLGVQGGTAGGTGNGAGTRPAQVALGAAPAPAPAAVPLARAATLSHAPQVLYKPRPVYTPEAAALHLEGTVSVRIRVAASGLVTVLGVTKGLGHGLDEAAAKAAAQIRFKPAQDDTGNPTDWEGIVNILFQTS